MPIRSLYADVTIPDVLFHHLLLRAANSIAEHNPDKKAFINGAHPDDYLTFGQLKEHSSAVAQFLHNAGFVKQTACTVLSNCHQFAPFFLGVSAQGGALSGAPAHLTEYELSCQLKATACTVVLTDANHLDLVMRTAKESTSLKTVIVVGSSAAKLPPSSTDGPRYFTWDEVIATKVDTTRSPVTINPVEDVVLLPFSSGTTGRPKGVMLTHRNFVAMFCMMGGFVAQATSEERVKMMDWPKDHFLIVSPIFHISGFTQLCWSLLRGATSIILDDFEPRLFLSTIQKYKIPLVSVSPAILSSLVKSPLLKEFDISCIKKVITGAAPTGKELIDSAKAALPDVLCFEQGYGMTELTIAATLPSPKSRVKTGTVGKLLPNLEIKILDSSTGGELPSGKAGELCVRGPTLMKGYLGLPEATKDTIRDGWLHTGDVAFFDDDGDLFIVDRLKELIKVKGLQVSPAELEDLLLSNERITDVAVIGVPDEEAGELPKAFVVRADASLTEEEVADFVAAKTSKFKHLKGGVEFVDSIPRTPTGKILRKELRGRCNKNYL